jgi:hypothetical protein
VLVVDALVQAVELVAPATTAELLANVRRLVYAVVRLADINALAVMVCPAVVAVNPVPEPVWCVLMLFSVLIRLAHCVAVMVEVPPVTLDNTACPYPADPLPKPQMVLIVLVVLLLLAPRKLL